MFGLHVLIFTTVPYVFSVVYQVKQMDFMFKNMIVELNMFHFSDGGNAVIHGFLSHAFALGMGWGRGPITIYSVI